MEVAVDPLWTAAGVGLSVVADKAYSALNLQNNQIVQGLPFEHTHAGLASYIAALKTKEEGKRLKYRGALVGFGTGLIIEDAVPGPELGNYFGLYNPSSPTSPFFVLGLYAIEVGALVALASRL